MSHQAKFLESVEVTPELVAFLRDKLEFENMSAEYVKELVAAVMAKDSNSENCANAEKIAEHSNTQPSNTQPSNVVPLKSPSINNQSVATDAISIADVAVSLALYQAAGNPIDGFGWITTSD